MNGSEGMRLNIADIFSFSSTEKHFQNRNVPEEDQERKRERKVERVGI